MHSVIYLKIAGVAAMMIKNFRKATIMGIVTRVKNLTSSEK